MQHAEVIYETGSNSVVSVDDLEEFKAGLREQHRRAIAGEEGGPTGHPGERVKKVLMYEDHPAEDNGNTMVNSSAVSSLVSGMTNNKGKLDAFQLIQAIRDELSPVYPKDQGRHESQFKAEGEELDLSFLNEGDA